MSWERIDADIVTTYNVYYSLISSGERPDEMLVIVPSTESSVTLSGLVDGEEYHIQVAVQVMLSAAQLLEGERSEVTTVIFSVPLTMPQLIQPKREGIANNATEFV